jgi:hypothetical protein
MCHRDEVQAIMFGSEEEEDARFVELEDCGHIIEVTALDRWMDDSVNMSDEKVDVKLKVCPLCSTPIRQNLRYGQIIKSVLSTIETVKSKVFGRHKQTCDLRVELFAHLEEIRTLDKSAMNIIEDQLKNRNNKVITVEEAACVQNSIQFLRRVLKLTHEIKERHTEIPDVTLKIKKHKLMKDIAFFRSWTVKERDRLGEQEIEEAQMELSRIKLMARSIELQVRVQLNKVPLPMVVDRKFRRAVRLLEQKIPLNQCGEIEVKEALKEVEKIVPLSGLGISEEERVQITKAVGLTQGHWFKCKNGESCSDSFRKLICKSC